MKEPIEVELKFRLKKENKDIKQDKDISVLNKDYQRTVMFDNKEGLMQTTNGRIRLRQQGDKATLSYKKPLPSIGDQKEEIEIETGVDDFETIKSILEKMEYFETTSYEKYTTNLKYKDLSSKIEIQRYPFATFIEIEGEKEEIEMIAKELGLTDAIKKSVDTLFCEWREKRGLPFKPHMKFDDFDK